MSTDATTDTAAEPAGLPAETVLRTAEGPMSVGDLAAAGRPVHLLARGRKGGIGHAKARIVPVEGTATLVQVGLQHGDVVVVAATQGVIAPSGEARRAHELAAGTDVASTRPRGFRGCVTPTRQQVRSVAKVAEHQPVYRVIAPGYVGVATAAGIYVQVAQA